MSEWEWLGRASALAVHHGQIAEHGGGGGLRDSGLLDPTLEHWFRANSVWNA